MTTGEAVKRLERMHYEATDIMRAMGALVEAGRTSRGVKSYEPDYDQTPDEKRAGRIADKASQIDTALFGWDP